MTTTTHDRRRRMARLLLLSLVPLAAACARGDRAGADSAGGIAGDSARASGFTGAEVPNDVPPPALRLTENGGRPFDLASERGKVVLVFFGYTNCPDICPTTLANWARAKKQLGADTASVRFVFVTVDPERDTPAIAQKYAQQFDRSFVGLSGSPAQLDSAQQQFRVSSWREPSPAHAPEPQPKGEHMSHGGSYTMVHASRVFVIGKDGRWRLILPASASVDDLVGDVRRLLQQG